MQGIALVGVFLRLTPFAARAGLEGEVLMSEVRKRLQRFFGKRGERVVDANLALIREAYEGVIDVTAGLALAPTTARREVVV
jgi:pyruvate-ferredoxin/flavodoxin oxidoreductase